MQEQNASSIYSKKNFTFNKFRNKDYRKNIGKARGKYKFNFFPKLTSKRIYIILIYSIIIFVECNKRKVQLGFSYIIIKTNITWYINIISEDYIYENPHEVIIGDTTYDNANQKVFYINNTDDDIQLIWYTQLHSTTKMFHECYNITEIDLSNFDASNVEHMDKMFSGCYSLIYLNLSFLNTSNVQTLNYMFYNCSALTSLDLSYFNTSNVISINSMFAQCSSLISLNLSKFNTSLVVNINSIFSGCSSLNFLDLSHFDLSKIINMENIFQGCEKLKYLNLRFVKVTSKLYENNIFGYSPYNLTVCSQFEDWENFFIKKQEVNCNSKDNNTILYDDENELKCYMNVSMEGNNKYICGICGDNYFTKYTDSNDLINSDIDCYESPKGYYLDENDWI